jgi:hypothetical protein
VGGAYALEKAVDGDAQGVGGRVGHVGEGVHDLVRTVDDGALDREVAEDVD